MSNPLYLVVVAVYSVSQDEESRNKSSSDNLKTDEVKTNAKLDMSIVLQILPVPVVLNHSVFYAQT